LIDPSATAMSNWARYFDYIDPPFSAKRKPTARRGCQSSLSRQPVQSTASACRQVLFLSTITVVHPLPEGDRNAHISIFERVPSLNSKDFAAPYASVLAFLPCQSLRPRKIDFHGVPRPNRCRYRHLHKNTALADVGASAVKKSIRLRQPDAYRPREIRPHFTALLD